MSGTLTLPPGMFAWKSDNPNGPPIAPYDTGGLSGHDATAIQSDTSDRV